MKTVCFNKSYAAAFPLMIWATGYGGVDAPKQHDREREEFPDTAFYSPRGLQSVSKD
jgi:hypothetical protein